MHSPIELTLGDKAYVIKPLALGPLRRAWPHLLAAGRALGDAEKFPELADHASQAILVALNFSGYDVTLEDLTEHILDFQTMQEAFAAVVEVSGLKFDRVPGGNVTALTRSSQTGSDSNATSPAPLDGTSNTSAAA